MKEFTFHQKGQDHPEQPRKTAAIRLRVRFKIGRAHGPFNIEKDGGGLGPDRTTAEVNRIVKQWTRTASVGSRLDIHTQDDVFNLKAVEVAPPIAAPNIAPPLDKLYVRVFTKYGWVTNLGNWYCRYIAGTHIVSRHGYYTTLWKGAAQDFGADSGSQLELLAYAIVHWATDPTDTDFYGKIATVIVHDRIWTNGTWGHYSGEYHYHVHCDVLAGVACRP
jgi:hypothetical protein